MVRTLDTTKFTLEAAAYLGNTLAVTHTTKDGEHKLRIGTIEEVRTVKGRVYFVIDDEIKGEYRGIYLDTVQELVRVRI